MASSKQIAPLLPETLPEDFSEWDSEASPAPSTGDSGEWTASEDAHPSGETEEPLRQSADYKAILEVLLARPRASVSDSPAPVVVKQQMKFIDWDSEESPAPANRSEWEAWEAAHPSGKAPKPLGQSVDYNAILESLLGRPSVSGSASPASVSLKPQELTSEVADVSHSPASDTPEAAHPAIEVPMLSGLANAAAVDGTRNLPELAAALKRKANGALFQLFRSKNIEVNREPKTPRKKWTAVAAICACSILVLLIPMIPLFHHGMKPVAKQSVPSPPRVSVAQLGTNTPKPSAGEPLTQVKPPAAIEMQQATDNQLAQQDARAIPAKVQTNMMNDQLTAPTRIPQGIKNQAAANAPPPVSFGAASADGLGGNGAMDGVFNGHAQPAMKVTPSKPLTISSGVAAGMLIRKPPLTYPPIAKAARVSGTVQLQATISKNGTIMDLQVVKGPAMLRKAALDAVRGWRYKPYMLNNQPTEVETTIDVIFSLGG